MLSQLKSRLWPNWKKTPEEAITLKPGWNAFKGYAAFLKVRVYREKENRWYDLEEPKQW